MQLGQIVVGNSFSSIVKRIVSAAGIALTLLGKKALVFSVFNIRLSIPQSLWIISPPIAWS
jgi:hypothetical protein